ncbi:MAG: AtpZ/AtpI family protein [Aureibaculum sp.]|jgi:F0F1-type ATP synthase assembly protein I|nr:AtpZ/AtpI family protein [Aureibaculum sp.]
MNNQKQKKQLLKYARFSGIAFQLGATIYVAAYVGKWLDNKFLMEKKIFTLVLILIGLIASIWSINKQLKKINDEE